MIEEYNHLSRLRTNRLPSLMYVIYALDGRISHMAYDLLCTRFEVTQEARVTMTTKTLKDVWLYSNIYPLNNKFWLITISDAENLTKAQYNLLTRTSNCVFILQTDKFKGYTGITDALSTALKKSTGGAMLLNLGYLNRNLMYNLVTHYEVEEQVSEKLRHSLSWQYGTQSTEVIDMLLQLKVSNEKLTKSMIISYLGYPKSSLQDTAMEILWFKPSLAEGASQRKIVNRIRKIYYPCNGYGEKYSYRSLQDKLEEVFRSFITIKTAYIKGTQKEYKEEIDDKNLRYSYRRYDDKLACLSLAEITKCLLELTSTRWSEGEDVLLFLQEQIADIEV